MIVMPQNQEGRPVKSYRGIWKVGFAGWSQREAPERFEYVISTEQERSITVKKIVVAL